MNPPPAGAPNSRASPRPPDPARSGAGTPSARTRRVPGADAQRHSTKRALSDHAPSPRAAPGVGQPGPRRARHRPAPAAPSPAQVCRSRRREGARSPTGDSLAAGPDPALAARVLPPSRRWLAVPPLRVPAARPRSGERAGRRGEGRGLAAPFLSRLRALRSARTGRRLQPKPDSRRRRRRAQPPPRLLPPVGWALRAPAEAATLAGGQSWAGMGCPAAPSPGARATLLRLPNPTPLPATSLWLSPQPLAELPTCLPRESPFPFCAPRCLPPQLPGPFPSVLPLLCPVSFLLHRLSLRLSLCPHTPSPRPGGRLGLPKPSAQRPQGPPACPHQVSPHV